MLLNCWKHFLKLMITTGAMPGADLARYILTVSLEGIALVTDTDPYKRKNGR